MRVKCISEFPFEIDQERMGTGFYRSQAFYVTVGSAYTVLGVVFHVQSNVYGNAVMLDIVNDFGNLASVPASMFDILEGTPSRLWKGHLWDDGSFAFWPASFYQAYYREDLSEDVPALVDDFKRVVAAIEEEASNFPTSPRNSR